MKHIVGFSGGIDSQACARWVLNRFPKEDVILMNSDAGGNEHPLTVEFVQWYSNNIHPVVRVSAIVGDIWKTVGFAENRRGLDSNAPLDFPTMAALKGRFPARQAQFCTQVLKLNPQKRWMLSEFGPGGQYEGIEYARYSGVRADESKERAAKTKADRWDDFYDCQFLCPLFDWTKKMCFDYVDVHGEKINHLYRLGFSRVGCSPCVNAKKEDIATWADRFPEMIDKVRDWETSTGLSFFAPVVPTMKGTGVYNFIDDVVAWSRTARGGTKELMPILREACESKYGLCE